MTQVPDLALTEIRKCTDCGLCLTVCPTYDGDEGDSPRGRLHLLRDPSVVDDERARAHLDGCLECGDCHDPCPTGVRVADVIALARRARIPAPHAPDPSAAPAGDGRPGSRGEP